MQSFKHILREVYFLFRKILLHTFFQKRKVTKIIRDRISSIVIIRVDRIGDLVISLPAMKAFKDIFPQARLSVMVRKTNAPILKDIPWIDEVICYEGFFRSIDILRRKRFDMVVDLIMDYMIKTALISFYSKSVLSVGFDIEGRGATFNLALSPSKQEKHMSKHLLDLTRAVAKASFYEEDIQNTEPVLFVSEERKSFADLFLQGHNIDKDDMLFSMHPGGFYASQCWPIEYFAELGRMITKRYKAKIIIIGSAKEESLVKKLGHLIGMNALVVVGLPLDKLTSIIAKTRVFIGNNSGPLHIAAALNVPTVSTMGPTDPHLWWPCGDKNIVVRHGPACAPCGLGFCNGHICMKSITPGEVKQAIDTQMERLRC